MSLDWDRINEARQGYIDKRNKENEEIALEKGLTEEQISAIEDICRLRHDIHTTSWEDVYYTERYSSDTIDNALIEINVLILKNKLPPIDIDEYTYADDWILDFDWYEDIEDFQSKYYEKAQKEIDNGFVLGRDSFFPLDTIDDLALSLWLEHVSEVNSAIIEEINDKIEEWLRAIDEQYGTHYTPTGGQRLL